MGLKQLTLEFSYYFPWQEWLPVVDRILRHEKDLRLFETGAHALGRMGTPEALEILRSLSLSRATPGFREIVNQVLQEYDPAEAFHHHFTRLLQGSAQPSEANEGAHQLTKLISADSFEAIHAAVGHPDPLVFRHAIRLMGQVPSVEAATFLLSYLKDTHLDALEDRQVRILLTEFRSLPRPEVQEKVLQLLTSRLEENHPDTVAECSDLISGQVERIQSAVSRLRALGQGILDAFLLDTLLEAIVDKPAHLAKYLGQAGEAAQRRTRRIDFAMDSVAQSLAAMVDQDRITAEEVRPALAGSLRGNTGHAGVAIALAKLVRPEAEDLLDLLLGQADGAIRSAALEVLGERKDPALRTALLKLRRDAISDIADRSLWYLGQLPDPEGTGRAFLNHPDPEEVLVGLRFVSMHKLGSLVPDLVAKVGTETRETSLIAALEALGNIGSPEAVDPLLALLHSGQGPRIQIAIAEAVRQLGDARGALALCAKAEELNIPTLHTVAVEALAKAHGTPDHPLPALGSAALVRAVRGGWSDRNPWPLRRRIADALTVIQTADRSVWSGLLSLLQATLDEKRPHGVVAAEDLTHVQSCARAMAQLATG
jgi:HEAT repeat protein